MRAPREKIISNMPDSKVAIRVSGYRTLIAYRKNKRAIFLHGFAKNERENIEDDELMSLKEIAAAWLKVNDQEINRSLSNGLLQEVNYD